MKQNNTFNSKNSEISSPNVIQQKIVSLKELSIFLGRSENSIRYHIRMGRIKPFAKLGRSYSFDLENVMKQLQQSIKHY